MLPSKWDAPSPFVAWLDVPAACYAASHCFCSAIFPGCTKPLLIVYCLLVKRVLLGLEP